MQGGAQEAGRLERRSRVGLRRYLGTNLKHILGVELTGPGDRLDVKGEEKRRVSQYKTLNSSFVLFYILLWEISIIKIRRVQQTCAYPIIQPRESNLRASPVHLYLCHLPAPSTGLFRRKFQIYHFISNMRRSLLNITRVLFNQCSHFPGCHKKYLIVFWFKKLFWFYRPIPRVMGISLESIDNSNDYLQSLFLIFSLSLNLSSLLLPNCTSLPFRNSLLTPSPASSSLAYLAPPFDPGACRR